MPLRIGCVIPRKNADRDGSLPIVFRLGIVAVALPCRGASCSDAVRTRTGSAARLGGPVPRCVDMLGCGQPGCVVEPVPVRVEEDLLGGGRCRCAALSRGQCDVDAVLLAAGGGHERERDGQDGGDSGPSKMRHETSLGQGCSADSSRWARARVTPPARLVVLSGSPAEPSAMAVTTARTSASGMRR